MRFTIRGVAHDYIREDVLNVLRRHTPPPTDQRHKHFLVHGGNRYPIKWVLHMMTGRPLIVFNASTAYRVLSKLGFDIESPRP